MLLSPLLTVQDMQDPMIADPRTSESLILLLDPLLLDPLLLDSPFQDTLKAKPPLLVPLLPW